ncbi:MAG: type II 3-dehydroquinate dehydratase [Thermomicrobiales bacterium]
MSENVPRHITVIHGPNLNLLGRREPDIYGHTTLAEIDQALTEAARDRNIEVSTFQSNFEGAIVDEVQNRGWDTYGIIINAGALTHYSIALRDALAAVPAGAVEIHISNTLQREDFRHHSVIGPVCLGSIAGLGPSGYLLALHYFMDRMDLEEQA